MILLAPLITPLHFYNNEEGETKCRFELCEEPAEISKRRFVIMVIKK